MRSVSHRRQSTSVPDDLVYPEGTFRPMPSQAHERARSLTLALLQAVTTPQDLVAGELALLWNPQNRRTHLVPDILVALGVGPVDPIYGSLRRQYRAWDEGKVPDLVLEYASPTTQHRDALGKKEDYARLRVAEYVRFDPLEEALQPGLRVYRLVREHYQVAPPEADGAVPSLVLPHYAWVQEGLELRLRERASGHLVPAPEEARALAEAARAWEAARAAAAEQARMREARTRAAAEEARDAAEAEVARLRAEVARLRAREVDPRA